MNDFLKDLLERTIATVAEVMLGYLTMASTISEVNWKIALGATALGALITVCKAVLKQYKKNEEEDESWTEKENVYIDADNTEEEINEKD